MAGHPLIDAYLAGLARRLPAGVVDELADGVMETWHHHLGRGLAPQAAAHAAIADFGDPAEITGAFVAHSAGRRTARLLLATGPVVGICWGASLVAGRAWTWPVPAAARVAFAATLLASVACLLAAATSRHSLARTRFGGVGAAGLVALDAAMIAATVFAAPAWVWPMVVAVPVSLVRIAATVSRR